MTLRRVMSGMCPYPIDFVLRYSHEKYVDCMREILKQLALRGPANKYSVEGRTGFAHRFSHGLIHKTFGVLLERGYIEEESRETWMTGKTTIVYRVTFKGLSMIIDELGEEKWKKKSMDGVPAFIHNHSSFLPLVFGKWAHFVDKGVGPIAEKHLDEAFDKRLTRQEVTSNFLSSMPSDEPETIEKWNETLLSDPEIRNWKIEGPKERIEYLEERLAEFPVLLEEAKKELEVLEKWA